MKLIKYAFVFMILYLYKEKPHMNPGEAPDIQAVDLDFDKFVEAIYKHEPSDPFAYRLEFLDTIEAPELRKLLAYFMITGAKTKYNKDLAGLTSKETEYLRKYLLSIGYNVKLEVQTQMESLDPNNPDKKTPVNYFLIDFFPASPSLDRNNVPKSMI